MSVAGSAGRSRRVCMDVKRMRSGLVLMLAVGLLSACASGSGTGDGNLELDGRSFVSNEMVDAGVVTPMVPGTEVRLDFTDGSLGASAGCNSMGGAYRVDGNVLLLPEGLATTEMACDPARMDQDAWLAELLAGEPVLDLDADTLTVSAGDRELVARIAE